MKECCKKYLDEQFGGDADTIELARACLHARESADTGKIMDLTGKGS